MRSSLERVAKCVVRDKSLLDDVVQEVWLKYEKMDKKPEKFRPWANVAIKHTYLNLLRKQVNNSTGTQVLSLEGAVVPSSFYFDYNSAVEKLDPSWEKIARMFFEEQETLRDIGKEVGLTFNQIKKIIVVLREYLQEKLREYENSTPTAH